MMEESYIYDDLANHGDLGATIHDLQTRNNELQSHVSSLQEDINKLCNRITEMQKVQDSLSKNISLLYNTAKSELERKDRRIAELQSTLDDMIFRRNPQSGFKRKWEEPHCDEINKRPCRETTEPTQHKQSSENFGQIDKEKSKTFRSNNEKESDSHRYTHRQNDPFKRESSREENNSRDTRESRRDKRDSYRDTNRERGTHRDERIDERDRRRGPRDSYRENRDNSRGYRDKSRGRHEDSRSHRGGSGDNRSNRTSERDSRLEHKNRHRDDYNVKHQNENSKHRSNYEHNLYNEEAQKEKDLQSYSVFPTSETVERTNIINYESKEEGEVSDDENPKTKTYKNEVPKTKMDFGENLPFDDTKSFNVHKFIEKQQKRNIRRKSVNIPCRDEANEEKIEKTADKIEKLKDDNDGKTRDIELPPKMNVTNVERNNVKEKSTKKEYNVEAGTSENYRDDKTREKGNANVNIISDIVVAGGNVSKPIHSVSEQESKKNEDKVERKVNEPPKTVPNINKRKRESRVPRNLTEELNINLERSKTRQELILELFGSSEKRSPMYNLSDDGEIPNLKLFSDPDTSENSKSDVKGVTNPVTEFQIFKSNLPCLEKSNSLSSISVQIQKPTKERIEKVTTKTESHLKNNECDSHPQSMKKNENTLEISRKDMSLDTLNIDIKQCNVEDFPNMAAYSDSLVEPDLQLKHSGKKNQTSEKIFVDINLRNKTQKDKIMQCSTPKNSATHSTRSSSDFQNETPNINTDDDDPQLNYSLQCIYPLITPIKDLEHVLNKSEENVVTEIMEDETDSKKKPSTKTSNPSVSTTINQKPSSHNKIDEISNQKIENLKITHDNKMSCSKQKQDSENSSNFNSKAVQNSPNKDRDSTEESKSTLIKKIMDSITLNQSKRPSRRASTKKKALPNDKNSAKISNQKTEISEVTKTSINDTNGTRHVELQNNTEDKEHCRIDKLDVPTNSNGQPFVLLQPIDENSLKKSTTVKEIEKNTTDKNVNKSSEITQNNVDEIKNQKDNKVAQPSKKLDKRKRRCTIKFV